MTKTLAASWRQSLLDGSSGYDLTSEQIKIVAVDSSYTYSSAHDYLADIPGGAIIATSGNLTGKTVVAGTFDADDVSLGSPAGGDVITQLWLYIDTGSSASSWLLSYTDEDAGGSPISVSTNGENITLLIHGSGLFRV